MAATPSSMIKLGTALPDFTLLNPATGALFSTDEIGSAPAILVAFICNHCPFVKLIASELARLGEEYQPRGLVMVGISSNDAENYPEDSPAKMVEEAEAQGYTFPYLYDESQGVARAFEATCTPDFFLYDKDRRLVYRGQLDDARPGGSTAVTGADLRAAIDAVLAGKAVAGEQRASIGCNIKWK